MHVARANRIADLCARWGVGKTKIYELINSGELRAVKLGSGTRVLEEDARAFEAKLPCVRASRDTRVVGRTA